MLTVGFANFFSIIQPAMDGDMSTTVWSIAGPVIFGVIAMMLYFFYDIRMMKEDIMELKAKLKKVS